MENRNKTALIVVDMVYDFTNPAGKVFYPQNEIILPKVNEAVDIARKNGALIVFMKHCYRSGQFDKNLAGTMRSCCVEGTGGEELDQRLHVEKGDFIIQKRRYSAFYGTDLDLILREHGVKKVIVVGTKTNCCIRATVTDSYNLAYDTCVIRECVSTDDDDVNQMHLTDIEKYLGQVISIKELENYMRMEE